jgi:hypothetical protein
LATIWGCAGVNSTALGAPVPSLIRRDRLTRKQTTQVSSLTVTGFAQSGRPAFGEMRLDLSAGSAECAPHRNSLNYNAKNFFKQWRVCFRWTQAGPEDVEISKHYE